MALEAKCGLRYSLGTTARGKLYIGEDGTVFCGDVNVPGSGLYNPDTGAFVNGATVTFTLKNSAGSAVTLASAISMTYQTGSRGCYHGTLEDSVSLTENATYYLEISADAGSDVVGFRRITFTAVYRSYE